MKKNKCGHCARRVKQNVSYVHCNYCSNFFHLKCQNVTKKDFPLASNWHCNKCSLNSLPFSSVPEDSFLLHLQGLSDESVEALSNFPSFTIQSLLDQLPGQNFNSDDFLSDSIESKYYTPGELMAANLPKKALTMAHLNIASLQRHIDELRNFLSILDNPFDILCISETRLHDDKALSNVEITGFDFFHTPTSTQCGGAGIYIKSDLEPEKVASLSCSHTNISESIFVELKNGKKKNILIGCVYRHHTPVQDFMTTYFDKLLEKVTKTNKTCAILGDFNVDLIKYGDNNTIDTFYDQLSSYGFRPLILQPTRVTANSATLIDNIFINNAECFSKGGNITSAISDHFLQFSQIDIFDKHSNKSKNNDKHARNWRIFNKREFEDEISQINWDEVTSQSTGTDQSFTLFYDKIIRLLDEMAPMQKLTKKEIGLKKCPWITYGMLTSMRTRDSLYKKSTKETDPTLKDNYYGSYKACRNRIISLIRASKKQYYAKYFEENNTNVKKTWDGIRNLINVNKKSSTKIDKILADNKCLTESKDIANSVNNFFVNIGNSVEAKIPQSSKSYNSYLRNLNFDSVVLHDCSHEEVLDIIQAFSTSKACGPYSIPSKILK